MAYDKLDATPGSPCWWGEYSVPVGVMSKWRISALALWILRAPEEWRFVGQYVDEEPRGKADIRIPSSETPPSTAESGVFGRRIAFRKTSERLRLLPALPDRALVVRLEAPLTIPGGEEATVYVGLPLWLRFETAPAGVQLVNLPLALVSDTWFGPKAGEGELCYASRTSARQDITTLPETIDRARAAVRIHNKVDSPLSLETLRLPVSSLSLFAGEDRRLWTEAVTLVREEDGESAALELGTGPPVQAKQARLLAGPRDPARKRDTVRAFGNLIRGGFDALRSGKSRSAGMVDP